MFDPHQVQREYLVGSGFKEKLYSALRDMHAIGGDDHRTWLRHMIKVLLSVQIDTPIVIAGASVGTMTLGFGTGLTGLIGLAATTRTEDLQALVNMIIMKYQL